MDYLIETAADASGTSNNVTPMARRLYELARKHVGEQREWIVSEEELYAKSGSKTTTPEFHSMLMTIIADDSIPNCRLSWVDSGTVRISPQ